MRFRLTRGQHPHNTTQSTPVEDNRLNVTGRYPHSAGYLTTSAARIRFDIVTQSETQGRINDGVPVQAYLSLWRKPEA